MNRRDFLQRLGLTAAAISLSPLLDFAPIEAAPSVVIPPEIWGLQTLVDDGTYRNVYLGLSREFYLMQHGDDMIIADA